MLTYLVTLYKLWRDDEAATAVEYGLVIGLIAVALIVILGSLGDGLETLFKDACDQVVEGGCSSE
ncbi:Flp family type IVb pilin [uncultured Abyssibacter sp.]|uniref:Flp family type IVb pilin n=1 Tax=uncultured Abyssibacter sp. TaxID=2320202 RepID=UPI0032B1A428